ncbi:DUF1761 family protein [Carboxylicivirga taeanensis]|uniref:DUF1761 family protein n=1 Tax=Carboxylicivirga taeanensis TaxID=1416875 RepID=UPI003F6DF653
MKTLRGTIFGGIAYFLIGWVVYGMLLGSFYEANTDVALNRPEEEMILWAMFVSTLLVALFLTMFLKYAGASHWMDGIKKGGLFGLLMGLSMSLSFYSMTTWYSSFWIAIVDGIVNAIVMAIIGVVIVLTWGKKE